MATTSVLREDLTTTQDVNIVGIASPAEIVLATALIAAGSPRQKSKVVEVQLEYEAEESQTLFFEYSTNRGATWIAYSQKSVVATSGPTILSIVRTIVHHNIQLRIRSTTLGKLRVIAFVPFIVQEAKVIP